MNHIGNNDGAYFSTECPRLDDPPDGTVSVTGYSIGDTATYSCDDGFDLVGEAMRTCMDNSQWSGDAPQCISRKYTYILNPVETSVEVINEALCLQF